MTDQRRLRHAIETLTTREIGLEAGVLEATLAVLREALDAVEPATGTADEKAERKQIAVLFAQLDGLATRVGEVPLAERAALAGRIWSQVDALVEQYGGVVDKHMGDVVMAVFGLPVAREDDVERAVRCALAIHELGVVATAASGADPLDPTEGEPLSVRVGVNTGQVLVGPLGTDTVPTVIGDTVNVASRLRHAGDAAGVYLSESTWRFVQHRYTAEPLGAVPVRGRAGRVHAYRVDGPRSSGAWLISRTIAGVSTPLVGREEELGQLLDAVEATDATGRPQLLTLIGDAGVGKSRLITELRERTKGLAFPVAWLTGRSEPRFQRVPYSLLRSVTTSGGDPLLSSDKFSDGSSGPATALLARLLAEREDEALVVLALEDVHWADRESLEAIERMLAQVGDRPLLVLAVARPALLERLPEWGSRDRLNNHIEVSSVTLRPLNVGETTALVGRILRHVPNPPPDLIEMIVRAAGGNPYYVEELITVLIDDGVIVTEKDGWAVQPGALARLRVPDTLTGVVQARLDRLPERERQVLQQASVIGDAFWEAAVREVNRAGRYPIDSAEIPVALQQLVDRELIQPASVSALPGQQAFLFAHAVLREVTYETVLLRDRQAYHLAAANWLEAQVGDRLSEYAASIAEQLAAARQNAQAATLYEIAAAKARGEAQLARVVQYERRALEMLAGLPQFIERRMIILGRLGAGLQEQGALAGAKEAFEAQLQAAEADGNLPMQIQANLSLATLARQMGDAAAVRVRAEAAAQLATLTGADGDNEQAMNLLADGDSLNQ